MNEYGHRSYTRSRIARGVVVSRHGLLLLDNGASSLAMTRAATEVALVG